MKKFLLILAIVVVTAVIGLGIAWWWYNRPIDPVELSERELAVVEEKIEPLAPAEPVYEKGGKTILLSEREVNGLLNEYTQLGDQLKFEFATDALHARFETILPADVPVVGGKKLKGRARFFIKQEADGFSLALDDVTVWGISLPNDWLAGMKGKNLIEEFSPAGNAQQGEAVLAGVDSLKISPKGLEIQLKE
ncbi:hypothetical protein [Persicirhabdus sediminis]|uniref:Uncharacterized protein n=1 Tax=Persicirhabdus sediminis TaxID=454144 RepID=A0A8J7MFZ1_9BACT|nr:hypothetical protein [Persicirhabdus sediminis]MBK1791428.1 hypothetical protein [Persicirhabdus sediminis]